jgi:hypothetical protein
MTDIDLTKPEHATPEADLRERAVKRLKKRRDFGQHLLVFVLVNTFFVVIWAVTSGGGFFWPIFPMAGWGVGVVLNAWDVWRPEDFDEDAITHEMQRLRTR